MTPRNTQPRCGRVYLRQIGSFVGRDAYNDPEPIEDHGQVPQFHPRTDWGQPNDPYPELPPGCTFGFRNIPPDNDAGLAAAISQFNQCYPNLVSMPSFTDGVHTEGGIRWELHAGVLHDLLHRSGERFKNLNEIELYSLLRVVQCGIADSMALLPRPFSVDDSHGDDSWGVENDDPFFSSEIMKGDFNLDRLAPDVFWHQIQCRRWIVAPFLHTGAQWAMTIFDRRLGHLYIFDTGLENRNRDRRVAACVHLWARFWDFMDMPYHFRYFLPETVVQPSVGQSGVLAVMSVMANLRNQVGRRMCHLVTPIPYDTDHADHLMHYDDMDPLVDFEITDPFRTDPCGVLTRDQRSDLRVRDWVPQGCRRGLQALDGVKYIMSVMICNELGLSQHTEWTRQAGESRSARDRMTELLGYHKGDGIPSDKFWTSYGGYIFGLPRRCTLDAWQWSHSRLDGPLPSRPMEMVRSDSMVTAGDWIAAKIRPNTVVREKSVSTPRVEPQESPIAVDAILASQKEESLKVASFVDFQLGNRGQHVLEKSDLPLQVRMQLVYIKHPEPRDDHGGVVSFGFAFAVKYSDSQKLPIKTNIDFPLSRELFDKDPNSLPKGPLSVPSPTPSPLGSGDRGANAGITLDNNFCEAGGVLSDLSDDCTVSSPETTQVFHAGHGTAQDIWVSPGEDAIERALLAPKIEPATPTAEEPLVSDIPYESNIEDHCPGRERLDLDSQNDNPPQEDSAEEDNRDNADHSDDVYMVESNIGAKGPADEPTFYFYSLTNVEELKGLKEALDAAQVYAQSHSDQIRRKYASMLAVQWVAWVSDTTDPNEEHGIPEAVLGGLIMFSSGSWSRQDYCNFLLDIAKGLREAQLQKKSESTTLATVGLDIWSSDEEDEDKAMEEQIWEKVLSFHPDSHGQEQPEGKKTHEQQTEHTWLPADSDSPLQETAVTGQLDSLRDQSESPESEESLEEQMADYEPPGLSPSGLSPSETGLPRKVTVAGSLREELPSSTSLPDDDISILEVQEGSSQGREPPGEPPVASLPVLPDTGRPVPGVTVEDVSDYEDAPTRVVQQGEWSDHESLVEELEESPPETPADDESWMLVGAHGSPSHLAAWPPGRAPPGSEIQTEEPLAGEPLVASPSIEEIEDPETLVEGLPDDQRQLASQSGGPSGIETSSQDLLYQLSSDQDTDDDLSPNVLSEGDGTSKRLRSDLVQTITDWVDQEVSSVSACMPGVTRTVLSPPPGNLVVVAENQEEPAAEKSTRDPNWDSLFEDATDHEGVVEEEEDEERETREPLESVSNHEHPDTTALADAYAVPRRSSELPLPSSPRGAKRHRGNDDERDSRLTKRFAFDSDFGREIR